MAIETDATVWVKSERVVPRWGRAEWLEANGIPDEMLSFQAKANVKLWVEAGCHISVKGQVKRFSQEAIDSLCIPIRKIVKYNYPEDRIPDEEVELALLEAKAKRQHKISITQDRFRQHQEAKRLADIWLEANRDAYIGDTGDSRHLALQNCWMRFVDHIGVKPLTDNPGVLIVRNGASGFAAEVRESLIQSVATFKYPSFILISVMEVARLRNAPDGRPFATVVPVKFEVPGWEPVVVAWDTELHR